MRNIQVVDGIVSETESLMSQFYGDSETSFVFTADHGMSRIGNHGDGGELFVVLVHLNRLTVLSEYRSR